jgi:hypothetical protein
MANEVKRLTNAEISLHVRHATELATMKAKRAGDSHKLAALIGRHAGERQRLYLEQQNEGVDLLERQAEEFKAIAPKPKPNPKNVIPIKPAAKKS